MKPYPLASLNHFTFPLAIRLPPAGETSPATHRCGLRGWELARPYIERAPFFVKKTRLQVLHVGAASAHAFYSYRDVWLSRHECARLLAPVVDIRFAPCHGKTWSGVRSQATRSRVKSGKVARQP